MNANAISAECAHKLCSSCRFGDCACECHEPVDDAEFDGCLHGVGWDEECPLCEDDSDGSW